MVFHTGDNGDIWYTQVFGDGHNSGTWTAVPGNFTNLSVSVAQMGTNSNNLYLVYRGLGNDLRCGAPGITSVPAPGPKPTT